MYQSPTTFAYAHGLRGWRLPVAWLALAGLYFLMARLGLLLAFAGANVSPIWPPSGVALGALLVGGMRLWPGIFLGALVSNLGDGVPLSALVPIALGNLSEAVVAALLFRRLSQGQFLTTVRSLWHLLLALVVSAPIAATTGIGTLSLLGFIPAAQQHQAWITWATGDALGMLLITPLVLVWCRPWPEPMSTARRWEALIIAGLLATAGGASFHLTTQASLPLAFLLFPLQVWTTLRFGLPGATLAAVVVGLLAMFGTANHHGPFSDFTDLNQRLLAAQALLGGLAVTGLALGVVLKERLDAETELLLAGASVDRAHDLILWINDHNILVRANPAVADRLGIPLANLPGLPMSAIADNLGSGSWHHSQEHGPVQESTLRASDGTRIPVEVAITRITDPRLPGGYSCAIARDLTERKAMDIRLEEMAKMEALGRLAGGVAHDFNNVLAIIIGYAESLQNRQELPEKARKAISHIHTAGNRAAGMTRQLLAFSRHQVLAPRNLDLGAEVTETVPLLERLIGSQVTIHLERPDGGLTVTADPTQIQQVLMNLAANARDAMPEGGTLSIRLARTALDPRAARLLARANPREAPAIGPGSFIQLSVRDTGEGMPPEIRDHLFEPFFTTKAIGKGTGLGLSSVHGIVRQSGGFVAVDSSPGVGTCFHIYLPEAEGAIQPSSRHDAPAVQPSRRILVVDDQASIRELVGGMLQEAGHVVRVATDAQEAARRCQEELPDLLVTDLVMPGITGQTLAEELRRHHPGLQVIFMSGYPQDQLHGPLPIDCRFLAKPFRQEALLAAIGELWALAHSPDVTAAGPSQTQPPC